MISKARLKFLRSLHQKKFRKKHQQFIIEGKKIILEAIVHKLPISALYISEQFYEEEQGIFENIDYEITTPQYLNQAGELKQNTMGLAVLYTPDNVELSPQKEEFILMLDDVKDPGNLGTIIRIADWYGIKKLVLSETCVDVYNAKVVQSSMGSLFRVQTYYTDLITYIEKYKQIPIYAALLEGDSIYQTSFSEAGIILMGSESHGISKTLFPYINHAVTIPSFGGAESLNVAVATAIFCDNWRRNN